jgi:hypothetical protein
MRTGQHPEKDLGTTGLPAVTIDHRMVMPEPNSGCWFWLGTLTNGYGRVVRSGHGRRPNIARSVHRLSYIAVKGSIPDGLHLDHLCRVRCCVNPDHLEPVTPRENVRRGLRNQHTSKTQCPLGHCYDSQNTLIKRDGSRRCKTCDAARARRYRAKQKVSL